ncbi:DUF7249 family protein [Burkholderia sp. BDU5]|uniref:DUF7249 family protein n=1 Tax=Burkholderia sp. BDU5 TaxID=1385590 RepID=UPI000A60A600|nr:hypothetical protein [Burkholderia sp. BDU5]
MYNGHKNWNHWNVSLWINNDEGLYDLARRARREARRSLWRKAGFRTSTELAAGLFIQELQSIGVYKTPDGAKYTKTAVLAALQGMEG